MAYIDREKLVKAINRLYPGYDEIGQPFLMRSQVIKVIQEQPELETEKCCFTCMEWDREKKMNNRCFCEYIEAHTAADFRCYYWEDKNHGIRP